MELRSLLRTMKDRQASDLHLTVGVPPLFRIQGTLIRAKTEPLTPDLCKEICRSIMNEEQRLFFESQSELDFSISLEGLSRVRVNIFKQRGSYAAVFRMIPEQPPLFDDLALPSDLKKALDHPSGLILISGPTGSGKSTTLAAMIHYLNSTQSLHIVTIEDPIEFIHRHGNCVINQREIGMDTHSFSAALKRVLRQDPDVIMIGELRDLETIDAALTLSETGHLVLGSIHTNGAIQAIQRIISSYPAERQEQSRLQLGMTLQAIFSQQLIANSSGAQSRHLAGELLFGSTGIRNLIRENKLHQIASQMQSGHAQTGMFTMNQSLQQLVRMNKISKTDAMAHSIMPDELSKMI